jgi:hypothetical protein
MLEVARGPERRANGRLLSARATTVVMVIACVLFALGWLALEPVYALKAAGALGHGQAINGLAHFVNGVKGNLLWAVGVIAGVVVVIVGVLFLAGHSRAQDYAVKAFAGFAIIVCATGIVA